MFLEAATSIEIVLVITILLVLFQVTDASGRTASPPPQDIVRFVKVYFLNSTSFYQVVLTNYMVELITYTPQNVLQGLNSQSAVFRGRQPY